jgi:ribosomal protein S18 acetylase RimI-like enzyme
VRPLGADEIPALLALAHEAIPDTMASRLGRRFSERYHRALIEEPSLQLDGYFEGGTLLGFIVYSHDVRQALRSAYRHHRITFLSALVRSALSPSRVRHVLRIAGSILGGRPEPGMEVRAELLTIAVRGSVRGSGEQRRGGGVNVPHALIQRAFTYLRDRGVAEVKVFCRPVTDDPAANGFVRKEGFEMRGEVVRWGIRTNLYVRRLDARDAPESISVVPT